MEISEIANAYQDLIEQNQISFEEGDLLDLDEWTQLVVQEFLITHKFKWLVGNKQIEDSWIFKTDNQYLQFLDIFPKERKFMWATDSHSKGVTPDEALFYLLKRDHPDLVSLDNGHIKIGNLIILPEKLNK
jgi:hypothetical protein